VHHYASRAQMMGLPIPRAVDVIFPGATLDLVPGAGRVLPFPIGTRILLQVGDRDTLVGSYDAQVIWKSLREVPSADKRYDVVHSSGASKRSRPRGRAANGRVRLADKSRTLCMRQPTHGMCRAIFDY
jgi:hypothetical protein